MIQIAGEAEDGPQSVALVKKLPPAVVLMGIATPLLDGLEATRQICKDVPDPKVLILSAHSHAAFVRQLIEWAQRDFCSSSRKK